MMSRKQQKLKFPKETSEFTNHIGSLKTPSVVILLGLLLMLGLRVAMDYVPALNAQIPTPIDTSQFKL